MSSPLIVEFVGLPGAGKTTVCREVVALLEKRGYHCASLVDIRSRARRLWTNRGFFGMTRARLELLRRYPGLAGRAFSYALGVTPLKRSSIRFAWILLELTDCVEALFRDGYDILVLEQSQIQCIWSISLVGSPPSERRLAGLVQSLTRSYRPKIVFFEVDRDVAVERISKRGTSESRFDHMDPGTMSRTLQETEASLRHITTLAARRVGSPLTISGSDTVDRNAHLIEAQCIAWITPPTDS